MKKIDPLGFAISQELQKALANLNIELPLPDIHKQISQPPDKGLGHFAFPCFRFAKQLRTPPAEVANRLQKYFAASEYAWQQKTEVKGGFLNFFIRTNHLANIVLPKISSAEYFHAAKTTTPQTIMVEFSQPNTHKIFHVGHTRNVCLGDAIARIFRYLDHRVITANYIGDEGTHIAKCLWHLEHSKETAPAQYKSEWLGKHYVLATQNLGQDNQQEVSQILQQLENKTGHFYQLWQETRAYCLADFAEIYAWLGTKFDVCYYESEVSSEAKKILQKFIEKGVFTLSEGAYGLDLGDLGFFMVLKSDGNTLYATKDLALAYQKFQQYKLDRSLYVVGAEQAHYFRQLFKTLEIMGFGGAEKNAHLSYGLVKRKEGKMSSRLGNIVPFSALQKEMAQELSPYLQKYKDSWSKEYSADVLHRLSAGTIKYGMLQSDPHKEIIFDLAEWLRFDGNTGPYLMYAYARTNSIISKAKTSPSYEHLDLLVEPEEEDLLHLLYRFNSVVHLAASSLKPSVIATHLHTMAKTFSRYYTEHSILHAKSHNLVTARLALVNCFAKTLKTGLNLLGIDPPERM